MTEPQEYTQDNEAQEPQFEQDQEDIKRIIQNVKDSDDHLADTLDEMRIDYDFYASRQWSDDDMAKLNQENRPCVTMNRIPRIINAVAGLEIHNRQEAQLVARQVDNNGYADVANGSLQWARDGCDAEDEDSQCFQDTLICGYGYTETKMDYDENPDGNVVVHRVDPLQMRYDPTARKKNLVDAKWIARKVEMTRDEVMAMWPNADIDSAFEDTSLPDHRSPHNATEAKLYKNDQSNGQYQKNLISVLQYQEYKNVNAYRVLNPSTNQIEELNEQQFSHISTMMTGMPLKFAKIKKRIYWQWFLIGELKLEKVKLTCGQFTLKANTGLYDRNNNVFFGLVRLMRDSQMWSNKFFSQIMHIINSNAKNGLLAEVGAFQNPRKAEENWASPDKIIFLNEGAISKGKIQERAMPAYPEGVDRLMQYAMQAISDTSGVSLEFLGLTDRDQAGVLEAQRMKQGTLILAPFFDSLRRYRKNQARVMFAYIREYIADGRLIRVVGEQGAQYLPLIRDQLNFDYDIIVDDAPSSPNVKERTFALLSQNILPICLEAGIPIPPKVIDYAPLPDALIQEWKQMLQPDPQQQQMQQQMQQLQMTMQQLQAAHLQAKTIHETQKAKVADSTMAKNYAEAQHQAAIGENEHLQSLHKMGLAHNEQQINNVETMLDTARKNFESIANQQRKSADAAQSMNLKATMAAQKMAIQRQESQWRMANSTSEQS